MPFVFLKNRIEFFLWHLCDLRLFNFYYWGVMRLRICLSVVSHMFCNSVGMDVFPSFYASCLLCFPWALMEGFLYNGYTSWCWRNGYSHPNDCSLFLIEYWWNIIQGRLSMTWTSVKGPPVWVSFCGGRMLWSSTELSV